MATMGRPYRTIRMGDQSKVMLTFWGTASEDRLHNIVCVKPDGTERWRAVLPAAAAARDCFVFLKQEGERLLAKTWSGIVVELCPATGAHLSLSSCHQRLAA